MKFANNLMNAALSRKAKEFLAPLHDAENAVPVSIEEMGKYLEDIMLRKSSLP